MYTTNRRSLSTDKLSMNLLKWDKIRVVTSNRDYLFRSDKSHIGLTLAHMRDAERNVH